MRWRYIKGFEGCYEVSEAGHVRNSVTGRALKLVPSTNGYLRVSLGRGHENRLVHRLVAQAFCEGYAEHLDVNHKNGIRPDNRAENVEWVTRSENIAHSHRVLGRKRHAWARPVAVRGQGFVMVFADQSALAKVLGVVPGSVASAIRKNHKVKGCEVTYV